MISIMQTSDEYPLFECLRLASGITKHAVTVSHLETDDLYMLKVMERDAKAMYRRLERWWNEPHDTHSIMWPLSVTRLQLHQWLSSIEAIFVKNVAGLDHPAGNGS